ncbi:PAS domain-containing protein [Natronorubrum tibetense]|uniref:PAS sensor protein n=1 Tax=Natronorubrum tibetense GA33 TaxID=1114856 RepID=L9VG78_9EURY|nr:PAS domain-containing protein [Natronorubrum tibetense]ELY36225.1 PAS sensor protein [Natronorubrum tibetense GA33]
MIPSTATSDGDCTPVSDPITALVVANGHQSGDRLEATTGDEFTIRTAESITDAMARLEDVDCLVSEYTLADGDGLDLLDRMTDRTPALPIVFLVDDSHDSSVAVDAIHRHRWADCVAHPDTTTLPDRLRHRVETLVEHRRLAALSRRSLASVELAQDAVAIAAPDGHLEFANRSFAMQFGADRDALCGTVWQTLFTDDCVERLEATAIPTVADGWRWTGSCTGLRGSGEPFDVRVRLGGLEDGSLVFGVDTPARDGGTNETA